MGGTDFSDPEAVRAEKARLTSVTEGRKLMMHLAPPCASFSRARDRSSRTRLRSSKFPRGFEQSDEKVAQGNLIGDRAFEFAEWALGNLDAMISMEN